MNGGYIMIDCKGLNLLAQASQTITGLHARVTEAVKTGKPVLACNCNYGEGVHMSPMVVAVIDEDGTWICTFSVLQILVTSADSVTIRNLTQMDNRTVTNTKSVKK